MGSCGTKLQKEHECINILPSQQYHSKFNPIKTNTIKLKQSETPEINAPIVEDLTTHDRRKSSDSILSSSFQLRHINITDDEILPIQTDNSQINIPQNIQNEALINLQFNRTLFCEDITYEYALNCNLDSGFNVTLNDEIIPQWILRVTVEKLTKFYAETLEKYATNRIKSIPCQFGKVMKPKVFTELLNNILSQPQLLKDANKFFSETSANFLNIPYDIRSIIQYNSDAFNNELDNDFKYWDIINENNDKYKYLCHYWTVYKHDYNYDDCCQCYDEPEIECYSYWIRSLKYNIDFLLNITSNNIFYTIMSDAAYNITQILIEYGFDNNSAWIITDYLPKYLLFNHNDNKCNAQIIYKYDPRNDDIYDEEMDMDASMDDDEEYGVFLLDIIGNKLLERHNITNINDIHNMCTQLRIQHTSLPPSLPEMSPSLSEYIINENSTHNPIICQNVNESSIIDFEESIFSSTNTNDNITGDTELEEEKYRIFFDAFIDEEGEDDINLYQWMCSLQKIGLCINEKEIIQTFNFMLKQNEDSEGYIDFVDFTKFCNTNIKNNNQHVKRTQELLNNFIKRN